ncbi:50S ribosomal protein L25/general stress protein Ctc [Kiloniella laminariae]|uniref:Large ribosomal subunit protein bL25 n=1 Tax=Kiloniella laminariae TaxID=454162 RepID=A0ABT4LL69_9PROT|nr:50S ribosomal protein L25/general stress protein Ctc [Kiloniella laminariae]MCZ4281858.1 50S ribosomal protein L25/general stress protein Ctc [Kiloniella laminariae]
MSDIIKVSAEARERAGKGAARAARRAGLVPAVIYGAKKQPTMINLDPRPIMKEYTTGHFGTRLWEIEIDGKKERTLPRDIQLHPVTDMVEHVDFLRVSAKTTVHVDIPVHFINEETCPGLKKGGVLNVVRYDIELICRADQIPEHIEVDMAGFELGDSVHISSVKLPAGTEPVISDRDFTIATIAVPSSVKSAKSGDADEEEAEEEEAEA